MNLRIILKLALLAWLLPTDLAFADVVAGVNVIAAWQRQAGQYSDIENPERGTQYAIDPYELKGGLRTKKLMDLQYDERRTYRAIPLAALVSAYKAGAKFDMVVLHFENGMRVPVLKSDLGTLQAYLAAEACDDHGKNCGPSFEPVERHDVYAMGQDPRPIQFTWNKLVVAKPWHPVTRKVDRRAFSPWHHTDSLVGLEFVDSEAYYRQFAVGRSGGDKVFENRCQFCHGARLVGARFGWDFVSPLPLHEKRSAENLLNHVKYPKAMAERLGLQMPPQKDVDASEMKTLWLWMRDVARQRLNSYAP